MNESFLWPRGIRLSLHCHLVENFALHVVAEKHESLSFRRTQQDRR